VDQFYQLIKIKKMNLFFRLSLFVILVSGCNSNIESVEGKIVGSWIIEKIEYLNKDYRNSLNYNMLFFKKRNNERIVSLPETVKFPENKTSWYLKKVNKDYYLKIVSNNNVFNGWHKVNFVKDSKRRLLGITLQSDDLFLKCYKLHQDFEFDGWNW